jgi:hypothetical protein
LIEEKCLTREILDQKYQELLDLLDKITTVTNFDNKHEDYEGSGDEEMERSKEKKTDTAYD